MSVLIAPETPYGKELWKFDHPRGMTHPSDPTVKGVSAPHFEPYPAMLYKVVSSNPWKFEGAIVKGYPSNDTELAVMKNVKAVGYAK